MKTRLYIQSIGMLVGMIFGAGIFALPYSVVKAGIWWGLIHFLITFSLVLFLHLLYGEIIFNIPGKHRITGYVEILLGKKAKFISFLFTLFSYYGTLLIYVILGGLFLYNIDYLNFAQGFFIRTSPFFWSLIFLIFGSIFVILNLRKIGSINFYLTIPLFILVILLVFLTYSYVKTENFLMLDFFKSAQWFLPYGVFVFSFGGFAVIPEIKDILTGQKLSDFKKTIKISLFIIAIFYLTFIFNIVGISGINTSEDAFSGLIGFLGLEKLGTKIITVGSLIGFLAVFTSFMALATDLKSIFYFDYKISYKLSWGFSVLPILPLFLIASENFISILAAIGAIGLGVFGIFILLMAKKIKEKAEVKGDGLVFISKPILFITTFALVASALYEAIKIFI